MPRYPTDTDPPESEVDRGGRRSPTPVLGVEEIGASMADLAAISGKIHKMDRLLVDLAGLDGKDGRIGRLEDDVSTTKNDVKDLKEWRTASAAKLSVLVFLATLIAGIGSAVISNLLSR